MSTPPERLGRRLFGLAWPLFLSGQLSMLSGLITTFWVGRLAGTLGLAVIGLVRPLFLIVAWIIAIVPSGVGSEVARAVGAKDGSGGEVTRSAIAVQTLVLVPMAALGIALAAPLAGVLTNDPAEQHVLRWYLIPFCLAFPLGALVEVILAAILATGRTRISLWRIGGALVLEAATVPLLMSGADLGVVGVPAAELVTELTLFVLLVLLLRRSAESLGLAGWSRGRWSIDRARFRRFFAIGGPIQLARVVTFLAIWVLTRLLVVEGDTALAAFALSLQMVFFIGGITMCVASGTAILVGHGAGARRSDEALAVVRLAITTTFMLGVLVWLAVPFLRPVLAVFSSDPEVLSKTMQILDLARWGMLTMGIAQVLSSSLVAVGRTGWVALCIAAADGAGALVAILTSDPVRAVGWWAITSNGLKALLLVGLYRPILLPALRRDPR